MLRTIVPNVFIASTFLALSWAEFQVTQVQVLFRHGDRTPCLKDLYPTDIHNVSVYEPWGFGQLTNVGKMREYRIGKILRERYDKLLGSLYRPDILHAVSTDSDRTKMSLQLVLAGLFPPSETQAWNSELPWIPIPIHYVPRQIDIIMLSYRCPEYQNAYDMVKRRPEVQKKIAGFDDLFELLSVKTGKNITDLHDVYKIHSVLVSQEGMNLTLPEWYAEPIRQRIKECVILYQQVKTYTTDLKRLQSGPLVRRFIENMRLNDTRKNSRKIYLYSGHDMNVLTFLKAHDIHEPELPLFGTAVMFEKLEDDDGNRFVKLVLWTGVTEQLITLRLPGCEEVCPIERYLQLTSHVISTDEEMGCHWRRLSPEELHAITEEKISYV